MKHISLTVFTLLMGINLWAVDITSSLNVIVPQIEDSIEPVGRRAVRVEQDFQIRNYQQDSLDLFIPQCALSVLILQEWEANQGEVQDSMFLVRANDFNFMITVDGQDVRKQFHYSDGKLTVPLSRKSKNHKLKIDFLFVSNHSQNYFNSPNHPTSLFVRTDYFLDSWYFITQDSIIWKDIQIHVPHGDNIELISNHPLKQKKDTYWVDFAHSTRKYGLAFTIIEKDVCEKKTLSSAHTKLNFYSSKYFDLDTISWRPINIKSPSKEHLEKDAQATLKFCDQVRDFFYDQTDKTFYVFKCFTDMANFSYLSDGDYIFVSFDSTLFNDEYYKTQRWQHEFVHCFTAYKVVDDSIRYLFLEGIATFCGWCMDYMNGDSVVYSQGPTPIIGLDSLMQRYDYYFSVMTEVKNTPILNINYSCKWATEVIYYKCPYVFYLLAKRVGMDKFIDIIRRYYVHIQAQSLMITLHNFEEFLKANGVSDEDWLYFISLIS